MNDKGALEQHIAELERDKVALEYALDTYESVVKLKDKRIDELYARITELNAVIDEVRIACDDGGCMIGTKYCAFISSQTSRITKLEELLTDAVRFIAYAQSKGVHGGEAIAKEIEENLNRKEGKKMTRGEAMAEIAAAQAGGRRADLREADLRWADLRWADLREADLSGADMHWAALNGADLSRANLSEADLSEADLTGADLTGADLTGADLTGVYGYYNQPTKED